MKITLRIVLVLSLLAICSGVAYAQVTTGTPPFGSFGGGPDVINLANLNSHLSVPVLNKPGRGTSFNYNLTYDSSIWYPVASDWQNQTYWGWGVQTAVATGYINFNPVTTICYTGHNISGYKVVVSGWVYVDQFGIPHGFAGSTINESGTCGSLHQGLTSTTNDGAGYTLEATGSAGTIVTRAGKTITPPLNASSGVASAIDRNGNEISVASTGVITDTLGSTALTVAGSGTPSSPVTLTYTAPSGATPAYTVKYSTYTVQTNFGCSGITEFGPTSESLVSEIDLSDQGVNSSDKYTFTYEATPSYSSNVTGRLASVTLPTGGTITYTYSGGSNGIECADGSTAGLTRQTPDGTWTYARTLGTGAATTSTITAPTYNSQNNQTVIDFQGIYPTESQVYQGSSTSGTLLKTTLICYNGSNPTGTPATCNAAAITLPITQRTTYTEWPGSSVLESEVNTTYNTYGLVTENDEYAYGAGSPGSVVRKTLTSYASLGNGIVSMPSSVTVKDGSGNIKAQTTYCYDEGTPSGTTSCAATGAPTATSGTPQHVSITGSRGNLTTVASQVSGSTTLGKTFTYYDTGKVNVATDVNGAQMTYTYGSSGSCGNSFATSVSEPLSLSKSTVWNCTGGVATSATDENGNTTQAGYTDSYFWRPNSTTDQLSNVTNFSYTGQTSVERSMLFNSSTVDVLATVDALGRPALSQTKESPSSTTYDSTETEYDSLGRTDLSSLPYAATALTACGGSCTGIATSYDALNRKTEVTDTGGGYDQPGFLYHGE